ncbi:GrpB family protein [Rhizobium sp. PAMB 3182]
MMLGSETIAIVDWTDGYRDEFLKHAKFIRAELGATAVRIDHIGSTSVAGLAGKPIVDIQISVVDLAIDYDLIAGLTALGYHYRSSNKDLTKRYFRERENERRLHIHVRELGSFHEQCSLLFRDFMRMHPEDHVAYVALKRDLAQSAGANRALYVDGKNQHVWACIRKASEWAQRTGWHVGPSDS